MILVIGYGNPYRADDGVGWHVVEALDICDASDVICMTTHQLTPELTVTIAKAERVILVDASVEGVAGRVEVRDVPAEVAPYQLPLVTHHLTPEMLLTLTRIVYQVAPPAHLITITGERFDFDQTLSPCVQQAIDDVVTGIRQIITAS